MPMKSSVVLVRTNEERAMTSSALVLPDVDLLKQAIHSNLTTRLELENNSKPRPFRAIYWDELQNAFLYDVIDEPIACALRLQLAELGRRLFRATGSTAAMATIADEIIQQLPKNTHGFCVDVIDKNWDGIGRGADTWVA
jgi:hypothetical protein